MPVFRRDFKQLVQEASVERINYEEFLLRLMEREFEVRVENRKKVQIRQAEFPAKMYLNDLIRDQLPTDANENLTLLERLDFIESGQNIIFAGNSERNTMLVFIRRKVRSELWCPICHCQFLEMVEVLNVANISEKYDSDSCFIMPYSTDYLDNWVGSFSKSLEI
ncbi:MAG: ATP-binding protein [Salinivirgaceae bacterium]|jgi:hypothetical protein|nr:ATP-binding protein [Salinivirgaceae bacterium]